MLLRLTVLLCFALVPWCPPGSGQATPGHRTGIERVKVLFTPTVCRLRCAHGRCTNSCERGNITTLYSSEQGSDDTSGFRVFMCPMLCKNGGVCIQKDRCLCPPNFTGRFCHIPASAAVSTNDVEKSSASVLAPANQGLTQSEYILPLQIPQQNQANGSPLVKVRVQHPPEATVKIHQVLHVDTGSNVHERSEMTTRSAGLTGSRRHSVLPREGAGASPPRIQAQTIHGDSFYTESSGFKYCFREVRNGQCSSPMPGLRSQETCCRGDGLAWGINECSLCPPGFGTRGRGEGSCPKGFERVNGTQCVDINECLQSGFCENGKCVNTRGSYSCVCTQGFLLDASHGICVSQKVISLEKDQCFRIVAHGLCSLPILRNITKQICCCSRVGKAWGARCEACPYFGSAEFKEICPAGPGYHYSPNTLKLSQRLTEIHGTGGPPLVPDTSRTLTPVSRPQEPRSETSRHQLPSDPQNTRTQPSSSSQNTRTQHSSTSQISPRQPATSDIFIIQSGPQQPSSAGSHTQNRQAGSVAKATSQPTRVIPSINRTQTGRPSINRQSVPPVRPLPVPSTPRPLPPRPDTRVCEVRPHICGPGRCIDMAGGRHTCACNPGFILNAQAGHCQDVNECVLTPRPCLAGQCENTVGSFHCVCPQGYQSNAQQNQCSDIDECLHLPNQCTNGRCENTRGSFRCVCRTGYRLQNNTCIDIDECDGPLRCPGQECVNTQGAYRCSSCIPGFGLLDGQCTDVDECRQSPSPCSNGRCENIPGSYRCVCSVGYRTRDNSCTDVNECEDLLQCPGQECVNTAGSYRCVSCRPGFTLVSRKCTDIDECRQGRALCLNGHCENTLGSYRCVCRLGYKLQGNTCADVNECEDPLQCPGQECVNTAGSYRCVSCRPGYRFRSGQCTDVDECVQSPSVCANGHCENSQGSYRCICQPGFRLQANTCTDVDECENKLQCPGQVCINSVGSFNCVSCRTGFEVTNGQCQDVNECSGTPAPCFNGRCENTPGSYRCICRPGLRLQANTCTDIDECEDPLNCPGQQCVNSMGSYECVHCRDGYRLQEKQCSDIDECEMPWTCELHTTCVNTDGSYRCECSAGYRATEHGRQCADINECLEGDFCFPKGECINTEGSYKCLCALGYRTNINGTSCLDVDECVREGVCQDGHCRNTDGSFMCVCNTGFTSTPEKNTCLDIDECVDSEGAVCGTQRCENTIGSFRCLVSCEPGYSITVSGECVDINECANETVCGKHAFCQNLIGTYQCICDQGYESAGDGRYCLDINECETMAGVCGSARCWNAEGSFTCECDSPQEEFDPVTVQCVRRAGPGVPVQPGVSPTSPRAGSSAGQGSGSRLAPAHLGERRECYYNLEQLDTCRILAHNTSLQECCCTAGQAWGLGCLYQTCPQLGTTDFQTLCPSGRGYVTSAVGAFSYKDVDECKLFDPEVCKGGVCVNNIPGYSCYCPSGHYYHTSLLECIDNDECESEETCPGGTCVNTLGSYYCTCEAPLVLDDTQRHCINITSLTVDENLSFCWQHVTADLVCQSLLQGFQVSFVECCCLHGEAWGLQCALCPRRDEETYEAMCSVLGPPPNSPRYAERFTPLPGRRGHYRPPFSAPLYPEMHPDYPPTDYEDYSPTGGGGGGRSGLRGRPLGSYPAFVQPDPSTGRYYEDDYDTAPRPPFGLPDPRGERAFGARPRPPLTEARPLSLAPLPEEEEEEPWRGQYEPVGGLMEDECGILGGCENGQCVRVGEGYTCDCYDGYQLHTSSMACVDVNECEDLSHFAECVNSRCVNTEGSYTCVCLRGFIMSRRPNHCIRA
ncbi:latent-transforming growth factor beta-binding protein 4 isoform X2 [Brachyhypopomus gauderio]|uniref:latent-transforming growth factor beta-binding protein 4 isoform X2 n=1 Tax=Brachyhypopomus gauderio TaxID=698409 RepID=UPI004042933A